VTWNSPTNIDPAAPFYVLEYEITLVEVDASYSIFTFEDVNVTDQLDPALRTGTSNADGPAPLELFNGSFAYPEPPEEPGLAADLTIGLAASGQGYMTMTNIVLGVVDFEISGLGTIPLTLSRVRFAGTATVRSVNFQRGDMNCDGAIDLFDIDPFTVALTSATQNPPFADYNSQYAGCEPQLADVNADGVVDLFDIDPFVNLLTG